MPEDAVMRGEDGVHRCSWGATTAEYIAYHDNEWGRPVTDEAAVFERVCLEGFQSGLSWITILRKRDNFRAAFANFEPEKVAQFDNNDVDRLLGDTGIVRHRGKIEATINNARATIALAAVGTSVSELLWNAAPAKRSRAPKTLADITAKTPESIALSKELIRLGFKFVGPTTLYAAMQAMGVVNDHMTGCHVRQACDDARHREKNHLS